MTEGNDKIVEYLIPLDFISPLDFMKQSKRKQHQLYYHTDIECGDLEMVKYYVEKESYS